MSGKDQQAPARGAVSSEDGGGGGLRHISGPEDFAAAFNVSRETIERLELYAQLVVKWQKAVNLVAKSTLNDLWHRHMADSAQLLSHAPDVGRWLDLGSGGGFPGMVVAILRAESGHDGVTLIESDQRKCAFLQDVRRQTGIAVEIVDQRIELAATHSIVGQVDVVSARALAPMSGLLALAAGYLAADGICLFLKGRAVDDDLAKARKHWHFDCDLVASMTEPQARIAVITRVEAKLED